ncbi:MAG TPA: hypothetical protein VM346_09775 [Sphingomicrobium sp.]|nr:hypothetical protein [Sphingomicrobium sp.]
MKFPFLAGAFYADRVWAVVGLASDGPTLAQIGNCDLPQPSEEAAMVFASYYEGAAVSPVRLGEGRQGDTTSVVDVHIGRGFAPLYVVIAGSRHSILNVSGWTRRVEKFVVATRPDFPTAVTGLPSDKIMFVHRDKCGGTIPLDDLYDLARTRQDVSSASMVVRRPFPESMPEEERRKQKTPFRMPEAIGGSYQPESLTLSASGVSFSEYRSHSHGSVPDWFKRAEAPLFHPAGLAEVNLSALVAPVAARPYRVLPDRAGLAQLVRDGKIEQLGSDSFRILEAIELPEGLCGSMSVTFTLAAGAPHPEGDLCHSRIQ